MRELLQKVGGKGLKRYLEEVDQAESQDKEIDSEFLTAEEAAKYLRLPLSTV